MASIFVVGMDAHQFVHDMGLGSPMYFSGSGEARKEAKATLKLWEEKVGKRTREAVLLCEGVWGNDLGCPVMTIEKWEIKTGKAQVLKALRIQHVTAESVESIECWTFNNDGKLYSWKGKLSDDPDLQVGEEHVSNS